MRDQLTDNEYCEILKERIRAIYEATDPVYCPYFEQKVNFNADGFHHFRYNTLGAERHKRVQIVRYKLFSLAPLMIRKAGTVQQHRRAVGAIGRKHKDGMRPTKLIEDWCFSALMLFHGREITVKVVIRKIGDGNLNFFSIMPHRAPDYLRELDDLGSSSNQKHRD